MNTFSIGIIFLLGRTVAIKGAAVCCSVCLFVGCCRFLDSLFFLDASAEKHSCGFKSYLQRQKMNISQQKKIAIFRCRRVSLLNQVQSIRRSIDHTDQLFPFSVCLRSSQVTFYNGFELVKKINWSQKFHIHRIETTEAIRDGPISDLIFLLQKCGLGSLFLDITWSWP